MIALAIIVVVLTCSQQWDPVNGCSYPACRADAINNLKDRIKYKNRFLACSYQPEPDSSCPCYNTEENGALCWGIIWNYGCKYYCLNKPHNVVHHPDGAPCMIPDTAPTGNCSKGDCHKINAG
uniref:Putative salivary secreted protein n=1 Tax=Ornithodoros turicata TaxID=34597 RepID=A0A2R5LAU2_9ACAR